MRKDYCVKCWKENYGRTEQRKHFICSNTLGICEGCGKKKRIVLQDDAYIGEYSILESHIAFLSIWLLKELFYVMVRMIQRIFDK
ncbi:hypothetical protein [Chakrabartyella piscis]|uniref:hypothetical protein n=1 Tax=Chakrabartyella piscis TaxID=2918914 RepID=UPI002958431C|nr:hypothetical protein [Chakrabartyella piscis]